MSDPKERPRALIWSPAGAPTPAEADAQATRRAVRATRLHNLVEFLASQQWEAIVRPIGVKPESWFERLVWIGGTGLDDAARAAARRVLGAHDLDEIELDWRDIDELVLGPDTDVAALGDPGCHTDADALARLVMPPGGGRDAEPRSGDTEPPIVIGCGAGLRAVWTDHGHADSEVLGSWEDVEATASDPLASHVVSADGRLLAVLHDRTLSLTRLGTTRQGVGILDPATHAVLPGDVLQEPRLVTVAPMLSGTVRLIVADEVAVWRLFLPPGGELSATRIPGPSAPVHSAPVHSGIDVLSSIVLFQGDGRPFGKQGDDSPFPGLRVRTVDAAFSGGVTVAAAIVTRGRKDGVPVLEVRGRVGSEPWQTLSFTDEAGGRGVPSRDITGVTVERRLDGRQPTRVVVLVGDTAQAWEIPEFVRSEETDGVRR